MKKLISQLFICSLFLGLLYGCQNVEKNQGIDYKEIEIANIKKDNALLLKANTIYQANLVTADNNSKKQVATVKYLDDIYQIASTRVNLDLEILNIFSDSYQSYIATMQAYSEVYLQDRASLIKNDALYSQPNIDKTNSGKMLNTLLKTVEDMKK